ncbi:MAG: acyl carrier protein [Desulfobacterales bacterium]|nr:acyl carrier protein [Desulfobacterales bacterium]
MTREELEKAILAVFRERFEIENPGLDENLREEHEFDSIDAIELLREIELLLGSELSRDEKKKAMEIRTINQILDYVMALEKGTVR